MHVMHILFACRAQIELASVEVRFQNLSIDADIAVGSRGEPTVLNAYRNTVEVGTQGNQYRCSPAEALAAVNTKKS